MRFDFRPFPGSAGRHGTRRTFTSGPGPCCVARTMTGNRERQVIPHLADFGGRPCSGEAWPWNSPIEYSSASTAAPSSFLRPASKFSSTTNNSRTIPSAANSARRSVFVAIKGFVLRLEPRVQSAGQKLRFHSSLTRAGRCCAEPASKKWESFLLRQRLHPNAARGLRAGRP